MSRPQQGGDTTSNDYHNYVTRMERMRTIAADLPHYPNVHLALKKKAPAGTTSEEQDRRATGGSQKNDNQQKRPEVAQPPQPQPQKKVQFVEQPTSGSEVNKNGDRREEVDEKETGWSVDGQADAFIRRKRLELCKWASYKVP